MKLATTLALGLTIASLHAGGGKLKPEIKTHPEAIEKFRDWRFGMFIHWGPVSLKGTEIGWSRGKQIPIKEYDQLYQQFNPTKFDADAWARTAKEAGMKYLVLTTKHHDGFCLWPTKPTSLSTTASAKAVEVIKEESGILPSIPATTAHRKKISANTAKSHGKPV